MALIAGSYAVSVYHGVLREDRYPAYVCTHSHPTRPEAQECSRVAKPLIREIEAIHANPKLTDKQKAAFTLPSGWKPFG